MSPKTFPKRLFIILFIGICAVALILAGKFGFISEAGKNAAMFVPSITATKTDAIFTDSDSDGRADPGDVLQYTVTVNGSGMDASNVIFQDTLESNLTLVAGSVNTSPIAIDESFNVTGNVRIQVPVANTVLGNDFDPDTGNNTGLTASGGATSMQGGNVTMNSDGSFSYNPPPGFEGADTYTYTVTDAGGATGTGTITFNVSEVIWFVNAGAGTNGDGRLTSPFNCLVGAGCYNTSANEPDDFIFLYSGAYTGGLTLKNNQRFIGQGASATLANLTVTPPTNSDTLPSTGGANPTITTTNATAFTLGNGNTIRGLTIGNTGTGTKISGNGFGTLTIGNNTTADVTLNGTGQALNLTNGTFAATSAFSSVATTSSAAQGISLISVGGTAAFGTTSVSGSTSQGILVSGSTANINFGNTTVGTAAAGSGGTDGVSLQNNSAGTRTFGTLMIQNSSVDGFTHNVAGGTTTAGATTISNTGQSGIDIDGSTTAVTFGNTNITGSGFNGVSLGGTGIGNSGSVTFGDLDIMPAAGFRAFFASECTGTITTTSGTISNSGVPAFDIKGVNAGSRTPLSMTLDSISSTNSSLTPVDLNFVSGNLTVSATTVTNPTGSAIQVQNTATGGTMNFGNASLTASSGTGVNLQSNAGGVTFADLDISPDSGQSALAAAQNTGTITSTSGTIAATNQAAINITGTSAASRTPLALSLTSVSSSGAANGIVLANTNGTFAVNGTGTTAGSGGTIQNITNRGASFIDVNGITLKNMNFTNVGTTNGADPTNVNGTCGGLENGLGGNLGCNAGIHLVNVVGATFDRIVMNNDSDPGAGVTSSGQQGINGNNVTNFVISNSSVLNFGNETREDGLRLKNLLGSSSMSSTIVTGNEEIQMRVVNTQGTLTSFNVTSSTFSNSFAPNGVDGIQFEGTGNAVMNINVQSSTLNNNAADGFFSSATDTSTVNVTVQGSTMNGNLNAGVNVNAVSGANSKFTIGGAGALGNTINGQSTQLGNFINVNLGLPSTGTLQGTISGNTITGSTAVGAGGTGIRVVSNGSGTLTSAITNNTVTNPNGMGIDVLARDGSSILNTTVTGNNVTLPAANLNNGIFVQSGATSADTTSVCADIGGAGGLANTISVSNAASHAIRIRNRFAGTLFRLPGYGGGGTDTAAVVAYLQGRNNETGQVTATLNGNSFSGGAACMQPVARPGSNVEGENNEADNFENISTFFKPTYQSPINVLVKNLETKETISSNDVSKTNALAETVTSGEVIRTSDREAISYQNKISTFVTGTSDFLIEVVGKFGANFAPTVTAQETNKEIKREESVKDETPSTDGSVTICVDGDTNPSCGNTGFTLPAGKSFTVTFRATIGNPMPAATQVSNQGSVLGSNFATVQTDDPDVMGSQATVTQIDHTTVAVSSNANPSVFGQNVTFTATLTGVPTRASDPPGTVQFKADGNNIGSPVAVVVGTVGDNVSTAQVSISSLSVGNHVITAEYSGGGSGANGYNANVGTLSGGQTVGKSNTTTGITSSQNPSVIGQPVTFTATVAPSGAGAGTPTGTVQFLDGGNPITGCASVSLSGGQAQCMTSALAVGNHTITAQYNGDGNFNSSSGSLTGNPQVVNKGDTSVNLTSSMNPSQVGQSVTFTATVSVVTGSGTPTGTVQFLDNGSPIAGCTSVSLSGNQAVCMTSALPAGNRTITAQYSGDGNFNSSTGSLTGNPQVVIDCSNSVVVTSTGDSGAGTLREAITNGVCPGGTITFDLPGAGPHMISLTSGQITIAKSVNITNSSGESVTVSASGSNRVFTANAGQTVTMTGFTIANGNLPAGIGGGIVNNGTLTLTGMTLTNNIASFGGAIHTSSIATLNVYESTLNSNTGISDVGGIYSDGSTVTLRNSTISGNTGVGLFNDRGVMTLINSTVVLNATGGQGGGIFFNYADASDTLTLGNTIVANNTGSPGPDIRTVGTGASVTSLGGNLIEDVSGATISGTTATNITGVDPNLAALANNGGPTQTHALLVGSPALDAGDNAVADAAGLTTDQRGAGFARKLDAADANTTKTVDIGAFEARAVVEDIADKTMNEDATLSFSFNVGDANEITSVTAVSGNTTLVPNMAANIILSGTGSTRMLSITPAANLSGMATITVTVTSGAESMQDTFTLTVNAVNDAPMLDAISNPAAILEDAGQQTINLTGISAGGGESQTLTVTATSDNTLLIADPTVTYTSPNTTGSLSYTPAPNANGTAVVTVTVTDNGGVNTVVRMFTVTVTAVNDAPVLDNTGNLSLNAINEDVPDASNPGTLVSDIISSDGGDRITDIDTGALEGIAVTAVDNTNGAWQFSIDSGANWTAFGSPGVSSARLLASNAATRVRFVPAADFNGAVNPGIAFRAWDQTSGTNGGTADVTTGGGTTAFSLETETASITVNAVNDAPSFTKGADQMVLRNAGMQTVPNWATNISSGPANESTQTVSFIVSNDNNALFSMQPAISPTGTLTYTPAMNASGMATVTVQITDNGGTANGGADTSAAQTFTITVTAVPGALAFNMAAYTVNENAGTAMITVTRTGGSDGSVTVDYATVAGGTAIGGSMCVGMTDYINASGTLTFGDGVNSQTFEVTICNDAFDKGDETINLELTNAGGGATLGAQGTAVLTIMDDDPQPAISIGNARLREGNSGTSNLTFDVTLSAASGLPVTVKYQTADGTALAGIDYVGINETTLTFEAGDTVKQITVSVNGDITIEPNETFFVNLSNPTNATVADNQAVGIIVDEDRAYAGDFDRDLRTDFTVFRPATDFWYTLQSSNDVFVYNSFGTNGDIPVPGDYDADGKTDLAVFRPANGTWYIQQSSNFAFIERQWGVSTDKPVQGDYDGDGKTDIAVFRDGVWYVVPSGDPNNPYGTAFGQAGDVPVQSDYDGDGTIDLAVYRGGTWFVQMSATNQPFGISFGAATDKPVIGDFDGDGKADFAVFRNGTWFIYETLTNQSRALMFGQTGDIPTPGDFDGDGTTDIAVYREGASAIFYIIKSSDNSFAAQAWGQTGDIPIPARYQSP